MMDLKPGSKAWFSTRYQHEVFDLVRCYSVEPPEPQYLVFSHREVKEPLIVKVLTGDGENIDGWLT